MGITVPALQPSQDPSEPQVNQDVKDTSASRQEVCRGYLHLLPLNDYSFSFIIMIWALAQKAWEPFL